MLHTDAHSACIEQKMTAKEFINNNKGVNGSEDFPEHFLESLYERVTQDEIKMEGGSLFPNTIKKGFLWMKVVGNSRALDRRSLSNSPRRKSINKRTSPTKAKWCRQWVVLSYDPKAAKGARLSLEFFKSPAVCIPPFFSVFCSFLSPSFPSPLFLCFVLFVAFASSGCCTHYSC